MNRITNNPHLVIQMQLDSDQERRFPDLENDRLYTSRGHSTVDCGGDYKMAAYLYSKVATYL